MEVLLWFDAKLGVFPVGIAFIDAVFIWCSKIGGFWWSWEINGIDARAADVS